MCHFDDSLATGALTDGRIPVTFSLDALLPEEWRVTARTHERRFLPPGSTG